MLQQVFPMPTSERIYFVGNIVQTEQQIFLVPLNSNKHLKLRGRVMFVFSDFRHQWTSKKLILFQTITSAHIASGLIRCWRLPLVMVSSCPLQSWLTTPNHSLYTLRCAHTRVFPPLYNENRYGLFAFMTLTSPTQCPSQFTEDVL